MRHQKARHLLSKPADQRKALLRTLATELLRHDEIITTMSKAKALRPVVERLITKGKNAHIKDYAARYDKAKNGDAAARAEVARSVHLRRQIRSSLYDRDVVKRVVYEVAPRYLDRKGGYCRIISYRNQTGDNTPLAIIQLV